MADQPEETESIDSGGARLFDWFLLPLLSLCGCRREETKEEVVIHSAEAPIDAQPEGRSLPEESDASGSCDCKPEYKVEDNNISHDLSTVSDCTLPPDHDSIDSVEFAKDTSSTDQLSICSICTCHGLTTVSDIDLLTGLQTIDNEDSSSTDHLRLSDLPMLPLLAICGFLRTDGLCTDLYNFRQVCTSFAHAVNVFLENPKNLPSIDCIQITCDKNIVQSHALMQCINYLMHPLRVDRTTLMRRSRFQKERVYHKLCTNTAEDIEREAQSLRGPVMSLSVDCSGAPTNLVNLLSLFSNVKSYQKLCCIATKLTDDWASFMLGLIRDQTNLDLTMEIITFRVTDAVGFFESLYSSSRSGKIHQWLRAPLFDQSTDYWQQWMLQQLQEGCRVSCGRTDCTTLTVLTEVISEIEWRK